MSAPRLPAVIALALLNVTLCAVAAWPHGGEERVFAGETGPYWVEVYESEAVAGERLYLAYLWNARGRAPVADAELSGTAAVGSRAETPFEAEAFFNEFRVRVPAAGDAPVRLRLEIDGRLGRASLALTDAPPFPLWPWITLGAAGWAGLVGGWLVLRRKGWTPAQLKASTREVG